MNLANPYCKICISPVAGVIEVEIALTIDSMHTEVHTLVEPKFILL